MKKKKISSVWIIVGVVVVIAILAWLLSGTKKKETVNFTTEAVAPANIENSVTATGSVEADTVAVGTQVSGIIDKIYVDYNSIVKKGQVVAELDRTNLLSTLNSAKASYAEAQANYKSAVSEYNYQKAYYQRYKTLYNKGLISADEYEQARKNYETANATVAERKHAISVAGESVNTAQTNLGYATITAPIDGIVIAKYVSEGQTVAASFSTPQLLTIAKNLTSMSVVADVDEADIGGVKEGQRASFTVDAFPDDTFEGNVTQIRLEPATSNNVVTYKVVINVDNKDLKLKPGLTANITIYTEETKGVLSVPAKALRFTPEKDAVGGRKIKDVSNAKNKVWTLEGNTLVAHAVTIGSTDGIHTQILSGIKKGQKVITGISVTTDDEAEASSSDGTSSPFAPGPRNNNKKK